MLETITQEFKSLNQSTVDATQQMYQTTLNLFNVKWTYINGTYTIRYYLEDKHFNKNYTIIQTNKLNRKLINTICKHNGR